MLGETNADVIDRCVSFWPLVLGWLCFPRLFFYVTLLLLCRYVADKKEKQSHFTGREQREGVWVLPFVVDGVFDRGAQKTATAADDVVPAETAASGREDTEVSANDIHAAASSLLRSLAVGTDNDDGNLGQEGEESPGAGEGGEKVGNEKKAARSSVLFDWSEYRNAFHETPPHAAITALFAEYALLVGRMTGHLGTADAAPMTLQEGASIDAQAKHFVLRYVRPILGGTHTTKVHKLLCHVMDAVRMHGRLSNCSTAGNEMAHKDVKRSYIRTNKNTATFTRQLVRHSQGARVLRSRSRGALAQLAAGANGSDGDSSSDCDGTANDSITRACPSPRLTRVPVSELRARPGLADVGPLLGLSAPGALVSVATHLSFTGELDGGKPIEQLVRASPNFRGAAWYDHVLYRVDVAGAAMQRYGQVMALVRPPDGGDVAVVVKMVRVDADESPLSARGCVRLRWDLEDGAAVATEGARVRLDLVRLTALLQVVHVVPDFAALLRRRGIGAEPVELGQGVDGLEEMVYLHNVFYPARPHKRRGAGGQ